MSRRIATAFEFSLDMALELESCLVGGKAWPPAFLFIVATTAKPLRVIRRKRIFVRACRLAGFNVWGDKIQKTVCVSGEMAERLKAAVC
jgi:hypothetical protein